jgi:hypothetical protein
LAYTMTPTSSGWVPPSEVSGTSDGESGFEAITGEVVGSGATATVKLFAVSYTLGDDNLDGLYAVTDTLDATSDSGESFTKLESAPGDGNEVFKGVSFAPQTVPEPGTLAILGLSSFGLFTRRPGRKPI